MKRVANQIWINDILLILALIVVVDGCTRVSPKSENYSIFKLSSDTSTWIPTDPNDYQNSLSKGINLSNWFTNYVNEEYFYHHFTKSNFAQIKVLGFNHVRLPIAWDIIFNESDPTHPNQSYLAAIDNAVKEITDAGLAVVLDPLHGATDNQEIQLTTSREYRLKVLTFWQFLVIRYRYRYSPNQLFFEIMSEPHVIANNRSSEIWWPEVQMELVDAIRRVDNHHFIIVGGGDYNKIDALKQVSLYPRPKIIYNFHFYEKMEFTHQGSVWAGSYFNDLYGIPYPSSPILVDSLKKVSNSESMKSFLTDYGNQYWNKFKIDSIMNDLSIWARHNQVSYLTCNEFGVYKPKSPRKDRLQWIRDIREALENHNIGWTMWEYDEGFGFVEYNSGNRLLPIVDSEIIKALGL